jgi:predicted nucleotidyltransferase
MSDRLLLAITQKHGAYNVRVFGSVARGEATQESDIDLLVDYDARKNYALVSRWAIA